MIFRLHSFCKSNKPVALLKNCESDSNSLSYLKGSEETLQETLDYRQTQLDEMEEEVIAKNMDITSLQTELEVCKDFCVYM